MKVPSILSPSPILDKVITHPACGWGLKGGGGGGSEDTPRDKDSK